MHFDTYFWFSFSLLLRILLFVLHVEVSNFSDKLCCGIMIIQVGKIKVTAKWDFKFLMIHCQNSALIMRDRIRKVRLGVDIFEKRILDSCKFFSDSSSEFSLIYNNLFCTASRQSINQYQDSTFYMFPFSLFLEWGRGKWSIEKPLLLYPIILFFPSNRVFYSTQGSVQPQETGESCIRNQLLWAPLMLTHRTRFNRKN